MNELFKCTRCGIVKPQHDYYHSDGYRRRQCIECKKEDSRSRRNVKVGDVPAYADAGLLTLCWELSPEELIKVIETKKVFVTVNLNGMQEMQPTLLHVESSKNIRT